MRLKPRKAGFIAAVVGSIILSLIVMIQTAYHIGVGFGFWPPITRPTGVSKSAQFVTTLEEQTWFNCRVDTPRDVDVCQAWDANGRLIADGDFRLEDEDRAANASELHPSQVAPADQKGSLQMIYLYGRGGYVRGRVLLPVVNGRRLEVPQVTVNP
jgi:hypothetical protein